ncbi:MAG: hypothetical protein US99_C0042G0002 [Candidatus Daviesbacteria bacterium GW2011_GWF2_38_6]|uniref:Uncharacterized protein n=1 Tax=Candidatus Daviesbacteria bacterium GW2011_GWF2_38_6 TaxID=1618432 RepID=A0A0G0MUI4_9BACT|nr:MAG: hypothetical protein US99_C0042G0002 [Candidatus Daviesbacteria bacterium GW2011_GWF2_38_6]
MQLFWIIFAFLFANILISGLFYFEVLKKIKEVSDGVDMKYGISCTFQKLTYSFSDSIPVLLISFVFGFELLAVYQVAYFSIALISGLIAALSTMYMPLLFKYKKLNYVKIIWQNLLLGLVFFVGFIVFIRIFFFTLYGNNYHESYILVKEFSFVIILMPLKSFLFNFFTAKNRNNFLIISNLMANLAALFIFYITRKSGFFVSIPLYFYLFSALVVVPLLVNYFLIASRKTDSILSEIN